MTTQHAARTNVNHVGRMVPESKDHLYLYMLFSQNCAVISHSIKRNINMEFSFFLVVKRSTSQSTSWPIIGVVNSLLNKSVQLDNPSSNFER